MKAILRLKGKIRPRRELSAVSYQQSALSSWQLIKYCALDKARSLRSFLQFILVFFVSCSAALAQESAVHATPAGQAEATANKITDTDITPLKIGDRIPDELWEMHFPVVSAKSDRVQYLSLGDFRDKLIILDFWATWCAPCISSLHKLDTLQDQFKDDLIVIPTSYESESKVRSFLKERSINLSSLIEEEELKKYFPHRSIPHQVWIHDKKVRAIASHKDANIENINRILKDDHFTLTIKNDILDYDQRMPLSLYSTTTNTPLVFSSTITRWIEGLGSATGSLKANDNLFINYSNVSALKMYQTTLNCENNRIVLKSKNIVRNEPESKTDHIYSYQLIIPEKTPEHIVKTTILADLNTAFGLRLEEVNRLVECYIVYNKQNEKKERSLNEHKLRAKNEYKFTSFIKLLNQTVEWKEDQLIYINESDYKGFIYTDPYTEIQNSPELVKEVLELFGLTIRKEKRLLKMHILSDI
jgi:thiol-disulfide isomerase/thioredoxin